MKVAVSAKGMTMESEVDPRFGRASCFLLFDTERERSEFVENSLSLSASHGAGVEAAQLVCRQGAEVLITGHVGPKAMEVLSAGGVRIYRGDGRSVRESLEHFRQGRLPELDRAAERF